MAQYKVVGLPDRQADGNLNKTVKPINKKKATIEAEKGETIWTNYNRNVDNLVELKAVGGKTHAKGGTPMDPPSAGEEGESSSFIFSNNRKMIIKDPELLKYFGETGKGEKTPAEVSKKWLDALATAKSILKDEYQDKIAKDSATLTMKNAAFNLSSLALWQESKKNFKDGMTDIFNPWFDKTHVTPEELFSVDAEQAEQATDAIQAAFGGPLNQAALGGDSQFLSLGGLKRFDLGGGNNGVIPEWKGKDEDLRKYFNGNKEIAAQWQYLESLRDNPEFKKALFTEYNNAWTNSTIHGKDYGNAIKNKKWSAQGTEKEVMDNFLDMQKRNLALRAHGIEYAKIGQTSSDKNTSKYTNDFLKGKGLENDLEIPGSDKTAQEQASYIAFHQLAKNQNTYSKELQTVLSPFEAPKLGIADESTFNNTAYPLSKADGIYTDTTTGQTAGFKGNPQAPITIKAAPEDVYKKGTIKNLDPIPPSINPDGFRIQDINTMNRTFAAKRHIINIPEWQKASQFNLLEPQFDSPERKIAEANTLAAGAIRTAGAFGSQASTQAAINSINAQVYAKAAGAIDDNSTKNIGLYNQVNQSNTQLANAKHAQESQEATNLWAQHATRVQNFVNSHEKADDAITAAINNAYTERSNRYNLNVNSNYEKIDPLTGKIYLANAKPLDGRETSSEDVAQKYSDLKAKLPAGTDEKTVLAILKGQMSGDWKFKEDDILKPDEVKTKNG